MSLALLKERASQGIAASNYRRIGQCLDFVGGQGAALDAFDSRRSERGLLMACDRRLSGRLSDPEAHG
jgi:hypothetical protein